MIAVAVLDLARIAMDSLSATNIQFGFDLFKELDKIKDGNIFFSPAGITAAIGMLLLGSRGATAAQFRKVGRDSAALQAQIRLQPKNVLL